MAGINSIGGGSAGQGLYGAYALSSTSATSSSKAAAASANASSTSVSSDDSNSIDNVTYRNACGDTVTLSGTVIVNRSGKEVVGQQATSDCDETGQRDQQQQKLAAAYSTY